MHGAARRDTRVRRLGLLLGLALLVACTAPGAQQASAPAPAAPAAPPVAAGATAAPTAGPLRQTELGVVALVSYMYPMWVAVEKGFGAQQGLDIQMTTFQTNEAVAALVSG